MYGFLKIHGAAAAALFLRHAGQLHIDAARLKRSSPGREARKQLDIAQRLLLKARITHREMSHTKRADTMSLFLPPDQVVAVRLTLARMTEDPLSAQVLAPRSVAEAYELTAMPKATR